MAYCLAENNFFGCCWKLLSWTDIIIWLFYNCNLAKLLIRFENTDIHFNISRLVNQIKWRYKKASQYILYWLAKFLSGYQDSNLGPPAPKAGALTGLRYIPYLISQMRCKGMTYFLITKYLNNFFWKNVISTIKYVFL